jgi:uncharacterized cupredoxin-like copper-binding protein
MGRIIVRPRAFALAGATVFLSLGAVACGNGTAATPQQAAEVAAKPAAVVVPDTITVIASDFLYKPQQIDLKAGQKVTLRIVNSGEANHDMKSPLAISGLAYTTADNKPDEMVDNVAKNNLDIDFDKGTTAVVSFTPTTAGTYEFHCDQPGHANAGMHGNFVVH